MTANIWNTYEMVGAAVTGVLTGGVPAIAFMILKQRDGSRELAAANTAWSNALKVQDANDRARWAPAYSGNLFAIEAEKPHDAEVLHVEYPTAELRTLADESEHKPNCPDLFYCPTVGEVESGCHGGFDVCCTAPELHQPVDADGLARLADEVGLVQALSDRPADDEDEVGDEQPGEATSRLLLPVLVVARWFGYALAWIDSLRARPEPYRGRHWVAGTEHTGQFPIVVPAQRTGDADA